VTGSKVVTHDLSATALLLDRYASDAVAVETEGHGFLEGAHVNPGTRALLIRGISDLLSDKDPASDTYWQPVASSHAAAFAVELLDSLGTA
jgi:nucleoside phosphorylase